MQVEIFCSDKLSDLEMYVNDFLETNKNIVDIKFDSCWNDKDKTIDFTAMIIYKT
jgi:hypothetical protein